MSNFNHRIRNDYFLNCFIPFESGNEYIWGIYLAPKDQIEFADMVMNSLYFERTRLPDYLVQDASTTDKLLENIINDEKELCVKLLTDCTLTEGCERAEAVKINGGYEIKIDCEGAMGAPYRFSFEARR